MTIKKRLFICLLAVIGIVLLLVNGYHIEQQKEHDHTDADALRSVIAEAYININEDAEFVNTATEDHPMEIPEKYYTYVESVQGDGRVYVFIDVEGNFNAYFGTPEKTIRYYAAVAG
jgi:hypothetical protein